MTDRIDQIIKVTIPYIDFITVSNVKKIREDRGISQTALSNSIDAPTLGYVGKVEIWTGKAKYNLLHLVKIARRLECRMSDLIPEAPPAYDYVELTLRRVNKVKKDGTLSSQTETRIVEERFLSTHEYQRLKNARVSGDE